MDARNMRWKKMYKCCWNCVESAPGACKDEAEEQKLRASKRFCCASYPVSNRLENPFKQRYCKQFLPEYYFAFGHEITKKEAEMLNQMTPEELLEYWRADDGTEEGT
jgi:hypothetical protein